MNIADIQSEIGRAESIVFVTGAGISSGAGIPVYRDKSSGWTRGDLEKKMTAARYGSHLPELWEFWNQLRRQSLSANPTMAHRALTDPRITVLTQNVDGLHSRAGNTTIELHGSVLRTRCLRCKHVYDEATPGGICRDCNSVKVRPDVVLFGEHLLGRAVRESLARIKQADVVVYTGTSGEVEPVASWYLNARGLKVLVDPSGWGEFDIHLSGTADEIVPQLLSATPTDR